MPKFFAVVLLIILPLRSQSCCLEGLKEKGSKRIVRASWSLSYGHLPVTPFHSLLQKVKGCVVRLSLQILMEGNLLPLLSPIKNCCTCQSESSLVKTIFILKQFAC